MNIYDKTDEMNLILSCIDGDKKSRDRLIVGNMNLVNEVVQHIDRHIYRYLLLSEEDLRQVGMLGLIKGVDTFNPYGIYSDNYSAYLNKCINSEIHKAIKKSIERNKVIKTVELKEADMNRAYEVNLDLAILIADAIANLNEEEIGLVRELYALDGSVEQLSALHCNDQPNIYDKITIIRDKFKNGIL